jgi:hypothetical protein
MSLAGEALTGIGLWITRRERQQDRDDAAIRGVLTAITTTKSYLARLDRNEPIDHHAEAQLVALWTAAAVHVRRTDSDLADRLQRKAEYWTNPREWDEQDIVSNRIRIDEIAAEGRRLLRET